MKKLTVLLVALVAVFAVSCKKSSPVDSMVNLMNTYTEKIGKAASFDEVQKLGEEMQTEYKKLSEAAEKELGADYKPTPEEEKKVNEAEAKFEAAMEEAVKKFMPAAAEDEEAAEGEDAEVEEEAAPAEEEAAPAEEEAAPAEEEAAPAE